MTPEALSKIDKLIEEAEMALEEARTPERTSKAKALVGSRKIRDNFRNSAKGSFKKGDTAGTGIHMKRANFENNVARHMKDQKEPNRSKSFESLDSSPKRKEYENNPNLKHNVTTVNNKRVR